MVDPGSSPGSGISPGGGNGYTFQYYCLDNSMDRGVWRAMVHGISELEMSEQLTRKHKHAVVICLYRAQVVKLWILFSKKAQEFITQHFCVLKL